jgi:hypothetical protein
VLTCFFAWPRQALPSTHKPAARQATQDEAPTSANGSFADHHRVVHHDAGRESTTTAVGSGVTKQTRASGHQHAMEWYDEEDYDVVVVGAGHAGCEAALAAAHSGCKTLLLTLNLDRIAWQVTGCLAATLSSLLHDYGPTSAWSWTVLILNYPMLTVAGRSHAIPLSEVLPRAS